MGSAHPEKFSLYPKKTQFFQKNDVILQDFALTS